MQSMPSLPGNAQDIPALFPMNGRSSPSLTPGNISNVPPHILANLTPQQQQALSQQILAQRMGALNHNGMPLSLSGQQAPGAPGGNQNTQADPAAVAAFQARLYQYVFCIVTTVFAC
jgi:hypothetical protein